MPRERKSGEGTYTHLPNGRVRYRVMRGYKADGTRNYLNFAGATEAECRQKYLDLLVEEREHGVAPDRAKGRTTLAAFAPVFVASLEGEVANGSLAPRTADWYRRATERYVVPALGRIRLQDLTAEDLEGLYARLGARKATAKSLHAAVRRLLACARRYRYLPRGFDPARDALKPRYKAPERRPPGGAELRRLLEVAESRAPWIAAWLALACSGGLRPGEILGLTWRRVRLEAASVDVELARETRGAPEEKPVKSEKGRRSVPLTRRAVSLLRAHLEEQRRNGPTGIRGLVFCNRTGGPLWYQNVYREWLKVRDLARLPRGTRPYDLRHAYATELLAEDVPLHEVSRLMGHASTHFTAGVYGHRVQRRDDAARSAIERALER